MSYSLGIDVGATFVAAAIARTTTVEIFALGNHAGVDPGVVAWASDGSVATGVAARSQVTGGPERAGRGVINRLGDPAPALLGGEAYEATDLVSVLLRDVIHQVTKTEGKPPAQVVLSHPASWGPFRRALFGQVDIDRAAKRHQDLASARSRMPDPAPYMPFFYDGNSLL